MSAGKIEIKTAKEAKDLLAQIQAPVNYILTSQFQPHPFFKKIPFLSRFIKDAGDTSDAVMQLSDSLKLLRDSAAVTAVSTGLQFGALSLAGLDFLLIPIIYLSAYILNQKVPITLNNNARWLYASALLGLTLTAMFIPGVASTLAFVTAGLTISVSSFLLGRTLYERYQLAKERRITNRDITDAEQQLEYIQQQAEMLQLRLNKAANQDSELSSIYEEIYSLKNRYDSQKILLIQLKEKQLELNERISKKGLQHILDKGLAVIFATLVGVACIVTVFAPPIGLSMLIASSLASLTYIGVRFTSPFASFLINKFKSQFNKLINNEEKKADTSALDTKAIPTQAAPELAGNSTSIILEKLTDTAMTPGAAQETVSPVVSNLTERITHPQQKQECDLENEVPSLKMVI